MFFNTVPYLLFLPVSAFICFAVPKRMRNAVLLAASYIFYCFSGSAFYIAFLLAGTLISYTAARCMQNKPRKSRLAVMWSAVLLQGFFLCFFKFSGIFAPTLAENLYNAGFPYIAENGGVFSLIAPLGISYYTFASVGYLADVAKEKIPCEKNIIKYALFTSFFPYIISGPIPRADRILPQLNGDYSFNYERTVESLRLMLFGFFKKIAVADMLWIFLGYALSDIRRFSGLTLFFIIILYPFWLYCDFSGYSDIARASAKIIGVDINKNFDTPLFSRSVKELWRRWHISLSEWLKDYIYIPLGGSRRGKARYYINLILTFLFSGVWHGVGVCFIIWGLLQAVFQIAESLITAAVKKKREISLNRAARAGLNAYTYAAFSLSLVFFFSNSLENSLYVFKNLFSGISLSAFWADLTGIIQQTFNTMPVLVYGYIVFCLLSAAVLIFADSLQRFRLSGAEAISAVDRLSAAKRWCIYYLLLLFIAAAFIMQNGNYVGNISFAYANF